ncbi:MAG: Rne/Rng family ribonuclease [Bacteroidota bacterium]|nr:Rne/Rng family ribonuclease [Candidatus Kapabacteria bacterium]MDW8221253.1 Rne/Rng family ribonuclease [Bacteroidota bacterium]
MEKEIFINATLSEIRVAITENGRLAELFWELPEKERHVGNIYLGRVERIVQGMNAAFIDIGEDQDAFLHFSDAGELDADSESDDEHDSEDDESSLLGTASPLDSPSAQNDEELSDVAAIALRRKASPSVATNAPTFFTRRVGEVTISLEVGQFVIVQVTREAYGTKGLRVTTKISLPGRYLVLLPFGSAIGVSKKIWDFKERKRLRAIAKSLLPDDIGCIVRTEAAEQDDAILRKDLGDLLQTWQRIEAQVKALEEPEPMLLHKDVSLARALVRDLLTADVKHLIVDSEQLYRDLRAYAEWSAPHLAHKVKWYAVKEPIFEAFGLTQEIERSTARNVPLPYGGYLVWDYTEAMTVVDVNSGRFVGDRDQEVNALRTNLEAAREVARQIRLRDIGGMIVIDCIDMVQEQNRRRVVEELYRATRADRAQVTVYPITQLGLLQMTRKRVRQNIVQIVNQPCPVCNGTGMVRSVTTVISEIERWLRRFTTITRQVRESPTSRTSTKVSNIAFVRNRSEREFTLILRVHPCIAQELTAGTLSKLHRLMLRFFLKIRLEQNEHLRYEEFRFFSIRQQRDITDEYR